MEKAVEDMLGLGQIPFHNPSHWQESTGEVVLEISERDPDEEEPRPQASPIKMPEVQMSGSEAPLSQYPMSQESPMQEASPESEKRSPVQLTQQYYQHFQNPLMNNPSPPQPDTQQALP